MNDSFTAILEADLGAVLALNNRYAAEMSWLTRDRLRLLLKSAYQARMTPDGAAFLLAFAADADYDSANFLWFRDRFSRFVYVDRVAVAPDARGRGLARALYAKLFERAALERARNGVLRGQCRSAQSPYPMRFTRDSGSAKSGEQRSMPVRRSGIWSKTCRFD